jgi:hypothetical protein
MSALKVYLAILLWVLCVPGITEEHGRLVGGYPANEKFPAVFLFSEYRKTFTDHFCTATKISPNQFLTAAHCVLESDKKSWYWPETSKPGRHYYYSFGRDFSQPNPIFSLTIQKVEIHPLLNRCLHKEKYFPAQCKPEGIPTPDLAVVTVEKEEGPFFSAPTLPLDFSPNYAGETIIMLGYGLQENGDKQPPLLKYSYSTVASSEELEKVVKDTTAEFEGMPNEGFFFGSLGSLINPQFPNLGSGDSGGPVLKESPYRIVGVNSNAGCPNDAPPDCEKTSNSFFARIDSKTIIPVHKWLKKVIEIHLP